MTLFQSRKLKEELPDFSTLSYFLHGRNRSLDHIRPWIHELMEEGSESFIKSKVYGN